MQIARSTYQLPRHFVFSSIFDPNSFLSLAEFHLVHFSTGVSTIFIFNFKRRRRGRDAEGERGETCWISTDTGEPSGRDNNLAARCVTWRRRRPRPADWHPLAPRIAALSVYPASPIAECISHEFRLTLHGSWTPHQSGESELNESWITLN